MKKIAVLGGGGTGCTMAADMTLKGHQVTLYEDRRYWENLDYIVENGNQIKMTGQAVNGTAVIHRITDDLKEAAADADVILIAIIATRHEELAKELAPLLKDGQTVCFSAGNCGSIVLRRELPKGRNVIIGEMQGNIYPCRFAGKGVVKSAFPYMPKKVAAFPGNDTERLIREMEEVYPCVPAKNVLEATFNSPNVSIHLAGSLLNTGSIEKDPDYRMYSQGLTPAVERCIREVEREKAQVMEVMGYDNAVHAGMISRLMEYDAHPELDDFRLVQGPGSMKHRYIHEDASTGQSIIISLADQLGIRMPTMKALVQIASVINGENYAETGKSMKYFGLEGMSAEAVNHYLETGEK